MGVMLLKHVGVMVLMHEACVMTSFSRPGDKLGLTAAFAEYF